ncbi:MAG: hypothetical protein R6W72_07415, partial [Desulfurivibrionaceae bacterium]
MAELRVTTLFWETGKWRPENLTAVKKSPQIKERTSTSPRQTSAHPEPGKGRGFRLFARPSNLINPQKVKNRTANLKSSDPRRARISRNAAYFQYTAMTREFAATHELAIYALEGAFGDAIFPAGTESCSAERFQRNA